MWKLLRCERSGPQRSVSGKRGTQEQDVPNESLMLTGDENIVDIDMVVQYHIIDAKNYLFNIRNQPQAVHDVAETALRGIIGNRPIDDVLTIGKAEIQIQVKEAMQVLLDKYASGVQILNTQLKNVSPPQAVDFAFKDVQSAKEDKDRLINEAKGYSNSVIPEARGKAAQIIAAAEAYQEEVINKAEGDAHRFLAQYKEYKKAPASHQNTDLPGDDGGDLSRHEQGHHVWRQERRAAHSSAEQKPGGSYILRIQKINKPRKL